MQKYILAVALFFNLSAMAPAIADPISLFVNQCLSYQADIGSFRYAQDLTDKTQSLEQTLLGLHNINDRLHYYRELTQSAHHGQSLLLCQVHLADELEQLLSEPHLIQWTHYLALLPAPYPQLGSLLQGLSAQILPIATKSQLHTAQASINFSLKQRQFTLKFNDPHCQPFAPALPNSGNNSTATDNAAHNDTASGYKPVSISRYLFTQPDEACRRSAWQDYQRRLNQRSAAALQLIKQIRSDFAKSQGVNNYGLWQLQQQQLSQDEIWAYLASQTQLTQVKPWNLAQALAKETHRFDALEGEHTLMQLFEALAPLGIRIETLQDYEAKLPPHSENSPSSKVNLKAPVLDEQHTVVYRIWHNDRLLGEIFSNVGDKNSAYILRQSLPGRQFGQVALSVQSNILRRSDAIALITGISDAIASLGNGAAFYLVATLGREAQTSIGSLWLSQYLTEAINLAPLSPREQLLDEHKRQFKVFNSKLVLAFYLSPQEGFSASTQKKLAEEFALSFGEPWQDASQLIYAFGAIANEGVSYYLPLWHQSLAQLIFQQSRSLTPEDIFNILIVNETYAPLKDQLAQLISGPVDPLSLIRRFTHASITQE
ncbi:hypothetical protein [Shewanella denitrificans]|jgi:hypothetical protein|nr:hypothetical protein [Shewanella denitrificans]